MRDLVKIFLMIVGGGGWGGAKHPRGHPRARTQKKGATPLDFPQGNRPQIGQSHPLQGSEVDGLPNYLLALELPFYNP